jgi:hypothetical protein
MTGKFDSVPDDEGVNVFLSQECKLGDLDVLYQKWSWDGLVSDSFIFADVDVEGLSDDQIEELARQSSVVKSDSKVIVKQSSSGFVFVNFNAVCADD